MRIAYHLGAHCTDDEHLLRCLLKNRAALAAEGIAVPGPARYRTLLRDTAGQLRGQPATPEAQALLLDQIIGEDRATRLVLSWDSFLGYPQSAVASTFYPTAARRMAAFTQIFAGSEAELFLAIRNPATWLSTLRARLATRGVTLVPEEIDPHALRWSDLVARLREALPGAPLTVWCDEDTPLLWPSILRAQSGHSDGLVLQDTSDLLAKIMPPEGLRRMEDYIADHPPASEMHRRRAVSAFLARFARPEVIEQEIDMPGWDAATVARLTEDYDQDVGRITQMDGVTFLTP